MMPIYAVLLGKRYRVKDWLVAGYNQLVNKPSMDYRFLLQLGLDYQTTCNLLAIRERIASEQLRKTPHSWSFPHAFVEFILEEGRNQQCIRCKTVCAKCPYRQILCQDPPRYLCQDCGTYLMKHEEKHRKYVESVVKKVFVDELASL